MIPAHSKTAPLNILIFGGTGDANRIAGDLLQEFGSDLRLQLSLAGRTSAPRLPDGIPVRIGGFGGAEGIISWLGSEKIDLVIDATHPYATQISSHVAMACHAVATPCIQFQRSVWKQTDQDRWIMVKSLADAANILPEHGERALIASGRKDLAHFEGLEKTWLLVRTVESPTEPFNLKYGEWLIARGPFTVAGEIELLQRHNIDVIVSKNSGGSATEAKVLAARELNIPILMVERPGASPVAQAENIQEIIENVRNTLASA
ncbi:cobalt-precorrin-6A reductase [Thalassospira alkalitolerans]|uniref:cobalt-precorrin-6A reductase n=1 Tax=Thalassospira alkalitolerans TaxID=1293890 RepID=UPI003AA7DFD8